VWAMTRDPWLDNIKLTLVTLVVVGHSWGLLGATPLDLQLYDFVYFWHIPAFVLITGHLSRSFTWDRRHFSSLFTNLVLPYLIFEFALLHFRAALGQHEQGPVWLQPHWAMWYLCVLFFWRLATPILRAHWVWIPLSVGISLLGGLYDQLWFGLPRILGLLPFFVLGLHLERRHLAHLQVRWLKLPALLALWWIFDFAAHTDSWARSAFLYYDSPYAELGFAAPDAMRIRLTVMGIGLLGTASVLALIPSRLTWYSRMGSQTLVVYLCHGFFVRYVEYAGWLDWAPGHDGLALVTVTSLAVALALLLASPPIAARLVWLVDPVGSARRSRLPWPGAARPVARQREDDVGDRGGDRSRTSPVSR
jgi:fucose 4-O-acetylase-like acetyltransferase